MKNYTSRWPFLSLVTLLSSTIAVAAPTNPEGKTYPVVSKQCDGAPLAVRTNERIAFGPNVVAQIYVHSNTETESCSRVLGLMSLITSNGVINDQVRQGGVVHKSALRTACRAVKDGVVSPNFTSDTTAQLGGERMAYQFRGEGSRATVEIMGLDAAQKQLAEYSKTAEVEVEEAELAAIVSFIGTQTHGEGMEECPSGRLRLELALPASTR